MPSTSPAGPRAAVASDAETSTASAATWIDRTRSARAPLPGMTLAAVVALASTFVAQLHGGSQLLYALLIGVALNGLSHEPTVKAGIDVCGGGVLRLGVGLLGARVTVEQIAALGWPTALVVVAAVTTTIVVGILLGRQLGLTRAQGVLSGGAVAICGASAALAISAVLPRERDSERFMLAVVVGVTLLSTLAMVIYPPLVRAFGLSPALAGLFLGGTIHDVAQVVGAGYTLNPATGDIATVVKLFRIALLTIVVFAVSVAFGSRREPGVSAPPLVPWFLWVFIAMVALNSLGAFSALFQHALGEVSRACLAMAIAALGMKTSFVQLARVGWRPLVLIVTETVWIAALVGMAALAMR